MSFDPFGDFESRGYLRNAARAKDPAIVRRLQHNSFLTGIDAALGYLASLPKLHYADVLQTHRTLFEAVFPWAGEDRVANAPGLFITKGAVLFAHPQDIRRAIDHALQMGQDRAIMTDRPGEVMGYLAFGHPFLDGNGRTIMLVHAEMARRAGIHVDWAATDKASYLTALTNELTNPGQDKLDDYLRPFVKSLPPSGTLAFAIKAAPGLDGGSVDAVAGPTSDPSLRARYEAQERRRWASEPEP